MLLLLIYWFMYLPLFVGVLCSSLFWYALLYALSCFAIILMRKRELVALLVLSFGYLVTVNVLWLFPTLPCVGLQFVIVVLSDHTHFLFLHSHPIINQHYYFTKHSCGILLIEYLFSTLHLYASNCLNAGIQTCFVHN